jgi:hypothetical protein
VLVEVMVLWKRMNEMSVRWIEKLLFNRACLTSSQVAVRKVLLFVRKYARRLLFAEFDRLAD